ncbi:hypothetical protein DFA_03811 [Cavenderia fasciculata]|uniref:Ankyrin repeat-containing protein n=1 Tax=Cavenderia fasciculata TaxID=261658 RepID=F4Q0G6_CACFS|nr:uncharacterized protein DFA_03811 [Cavenderia fasciculata]EGG18317.1 hypothetical protein DFA_03811 [Cavenderia fasciculata]|eukprot:XP_004357140.1 hypothetical protein DFA_03811 [Cavenderia fasciculata]
MNNNDDKDTDIFFSDVFRKVFRNKVLLYCIFKQVRIHRLEYLGDGSLPADPMRMYRYKDIKSVTWMIRNRYPRLLKHKLVHRHLTTLLNSNDVALLCEMVTEQDIDVFNYIYFKYSHLFLCNSVVNSAAKNRSTVHPLKLILSRTQQDGGYAMWSISTLRGAASSRSVPCTSFLLDRLGMIMSGQLQDPLFSHDDSACTLELLELFNSWRGDPGNLEEMARLLCQFIQELPPNLPVMPQVTFQPFPISFQYLQPSHFHLPLDVFRVVFSDSLGSTTMTMTTQITDSITSKYMLWLGTIPSDYLTVDERQPPAIRRSPMDTLKRIRAHQNYTHQRYNPLPVTRSNIEMIEYIESKLATYHSGQQRKSIIECMTDNDKENDNDEKEYKWVYFRWMIESGRVHNIPSKSGWVQVMIEAAVLEQRETELMLLLSDRRVQDNVDWVFTYYHDHGNKVANSIIRREIKKANPTTQFVTCIDEVDKDSNYFNQEYHQQNNVHIERVINRAIKGGHLPFIKKIYVGSDVDMDIYVRQLNFLDKAAQYNQFKISKWLIKKIKSDPLKDMLHKVIAIQTALETALFWGHYQITDLILSQVPKDYIFSFDLLRVVAISGNLEFFRAITKFVEKDYGNDQLRQTLSSAVQSGSIELVQYIINDLLKWNSVLFPFLAFSLIPDAIQYGHFDIVKLFLDSTRCTPQDLSELATYAINYGRYQVLDYLVQKCGYQLSHNEMQRIFSGREITMLQYLFSDHCRLDNFEMLKHYRITFKSGRAWFITKNNKQLFSI